jgi:hypothetical protein
VAVILGLIVRTHPTTDLFPLLRSLQRQYGQAAPASSDDANADPRLMNRSSRISAYVHYVRYE